MRPRYLILAGPGPDLAAQAQSARGAGLDIAWRADGIIALTNAGCTCLAIGSDACVIGTLFHRHGPARAIEAFSPSEAAALEGGGQATLLAHYWGGYVALWSTGQGNELLRDPSGSLPCYAARAGNTRLFASDLDLLEGAGVPIGNIAWDALGRHLHSGGLPTVETALEGVTMLLPGAAMRLADGSEHCEHRWSPWDHVEPRDEQPGETAERLRRVVTHCVASWASLYRHPLLSVSGGLDSSIVAACLSGTGSAAACLTLFTDDAAGDERDYSRLLCEALGLPLSDWRYDLAQVDLDQALGAHLPRPAGRVEAQPYERAHREIAARDGADAFFTGNGGDNVFGYSQSAAALADRALHEGPGAGAFATLRDICRQTGAGPLRVTRAAARIARQSPRYQWKPSAALLHPELLASFGAVALDHPWLDAPPWALPGKAAHIAGLLRAHLTLEPDRSRLAPVIHPLLSQPIIETCLSIPSWRWREGGRDRSVARSAFAPALPPAIIERRIKGTPDPFCGEIVRHKRAELRDRLQGGQLAAHHLIDRGAIDEVLRPDHATTGEENVRLLGLANVEAWLTAMASRRRHPITDRIPSVKGR